MEDRCICCGEIIPEGVQVCPKCLVAKKKSNADRIRAMTDEELAAELSAVAGWNRKQYRKAKQIGIKEVMLNWLQQPSNGGQNATD